MSYSPNAFADEISATFTDDRYGIGTTRFQTASEVAGGTSGVNSAITPTLTVGERMWIFVQAATAVDAGDLCARNAIGTPYSVIPAAANESDTYVLVGVADYDIAALSYGWIIAKGVCVAQAQAGVTAGVLLASDGVVAAGSVDDWTSGAGLTRKIIGEALEAQAAGAEYGAGFVQARIDLL